MRVGTTRRFSGPNATQACFKAASLLASFVIGRRVLPTSYFKHLGTIVESSSPIVLRLTSSIARLRAIAAIHEMGDPLAGSKSARMLPNANVNLLQDVLRHISSSQDTNDDAEEFRRSDRIHLFEGRALPATQ